MSNWNIFDDNGEYVGSISDESQSSSGFFSYIVGFIVSVVAIIGTIGALGKEIIEGELGAIQYAIVEIVSSITFSIIICKKAKKHKFSQLLSKFYGYLWIVTLVDILICYFIDDNATGGMLFAGIVMSFLLPIFFAFISAIICYQILKHK